MRQVHYRGRHRRGRHRRPSPARRILIPGTAAATGLGLITAASLYGAAPSSDPADAHNAAATSPVLLPAFKPSPLVQAIDSPTPVQRPHTPPALRWRSAPWTPPKMPAGALDTSQRRAYAAVARQADDAMPRCDLTGAVLAAITYVDHATHSPRAKAALPTAFAACAAGSHLDQAGPLTLALYRYARSGAYVRAVLVVADEYGAA